MSDPDVIFGSFLLEGPREVHDALVCLRRTMHQVAENSGRELECHAGFPQRFRARPDMSFIVFFYPSVTFAFGPSGRVTEQRGGTDFLYDEAGEILLTAPSGAGIGPLLELSGKGPPEHADPRRN